MDDAIEQRIQRLTDAPMFPFEGEFRIRELGEPMAQELARGGEAGQPCRACEPPPEDRLLWSNARWRITTIPPSINPVGLFLETNEHLDFQDFDDDIAAEYGVLSRHLEAAIRSLPAVGRVHIHRWGDGSAHFHVWFQGRPARQLELCGWGNVLWAQLLPALPKPEIQANHAQVINRFAPSIGRTSITKLPTVD